MNDFERLLQSQKVRQIPSEWRVEILGAALSRKAQESQQPPWWLAWLWPSPVAWAAVACAWGLIIGLNMASSPSRSSRAVVEVLPPVRIEMALLQQRQFLHELFHTGEEPLAEPPRRRDTPGASRERRTNLQYAFV